MCVYMYICKIRLIHVWVSFLPPASQHTLGIFVYETKEKLQGIKVLQRTKQRITAMALVRFL